MSTSQHPSNFNDFLKSIGPDSEPKDDVVPTHEEGETDAGSAPDETAPAAETKAEGAPPAAPATTAAQRRLLKLKEDGVETDFDLDDAYADETKRADLAAKIQLGRQHDKIIERRLRQQESDQATWIQQQAEANGFRLVFDPATQTLQFVPKAGSAPNTTTPPASATPSSPPDTDQILRRMEELEAAIGEGDAEAIKENAQLTRKLAKAQRDEANQLRQWRRERDEERTSQQQQTVLERQVTAVQGVFAKHSAAFDGWDDDRKAVLVSGIRARSTSFDDLLAKLDSWAVFEASRHPAKPAVPATPPAKSPPPVHGGAAPPAGGGSKRAAPKSTFEKNWAASLPD